MRFRRGRGVLTPALVVVCLLTGSAAARGSQDPLVLVLGDSSSWDEGVVRSAAGAKLLTDLGEYGVQEVALIVLANIPYNQIPSRVRNGLPEHLRAGGSLLVTGGPSAFGSGGYRPINELLPFEIRVDQDWRAVPFKPVLYITPNHPILSGVAFPTVGGFNDLNPQPQGMEIIRYAGGKTASGARYPAPLIGERSVGQGTVLAITLNLADLLSSGWGDGSRFLENTVRYLVDRSPLRPVPKDQKPR